MAELGAVVLIGCGFDGAKVALDCARADCCGGCRLMAELMEGYDGGPRGAIRVYTGKA